MMGQPSWYSWLLVATAAVTGLVWLVLRHENQIARLRRELNDPLLVPHRTARTYFYSIDDRVVC